MSSRARAAGRRIASGAAQTGFAMAGGAIYYGAHALTTPSLYGTDPNNIPKRSWMIPVAGVIVGHLVSRAPKIGAMGLGLAGGATAVGIQQIQMGISVKKNAAASGQTSGFDSGALLEPGDVSPRQLQSAQSNVGYMDEDAGALWGNPRGAHEAAGLSL